MLPTWREYVKANMSQAVKKHGTKRALKVLSGQFKALKSKPQRAKKTTRKRQAPKRKTPARKRATRRAPRARTEAVRVSRLPIAPANDTFRLPVERKRNFMKRVKPAYVVGGLGIGGLLLLALKSSASSPKPALPAPSTAPQTPNAPAATPSPAPVPPVDNSEPIASWSADKGTLNILTGYHRATTSEVGPEMKAISGSFLKKDFGTVSLVTADHGKHYAVAIEKHTNHPELGPFNKGVSIFVKDS